MADSIISQLPPIGALQPSSLIPVVQAGVTSVMTAQQLADMATQLASLPMVAVGTGTGDAILASFTPQVASLVNGVRFRVRAPAANTLAAPTLKLGSTAAKPIVKGGVTPLQAGDIAGPGHWLEVIYDQTLDSFELLNPVYPAVAAGNFLTASVNGGPLAGKRNYIINGNCRVAQRGNVGMSAAGAIYGGCDRFLTTVQGTTVSALLLRSFVGAGLTGSGYAHQVGNVVTTGASSVVVSTRLEGTETTGLQGKTVTMRCRVMQTSGAPQTLTLAARSANNLDDFSSNTLIGAGVGQVIPNNSWTTATFTFQHAGGNGTQLDFGFFNLPAMNSAQFYFGDMSLEVGSVATPMERQSFAEELVRCQRYYETGYIEALGSVPANGYYVGAVSCYKVAKRANPTVAVTTTYTGNAGSLTVVQNHQDMFSYYLISTAAGLAELTGTFTSSAEL